MNAARASWSTSRWWSGKPTLTSNIRKCGNSTLRVQVRQVRRTLLLALFLAAIIRVQPELLPSPMSGFDTRLISLSSIQGSPIRCPKQPRVGHETTGYQSLAPRGTAARLHSLREMTGSIYLAMRSSNFGSLSFTNRCHGVQSFAL